MRNDRGIFVKNKSIEKNRVGVLDGIRVISIALVVWFHFWQQSWIIPSIGNVSINWIPQNGAILVDMMILLSGFCLFLPYAGNNNRQEDFQVKAFYVKRVARIVPSYLVAVFIALILALVGGEYGGDWSYMWKDLIPHLTFTNNWFRVSLLSTKLNGVLWTVAVLVQFYLIFPLLVKAFQKKPWLTYWTMVGIGVLSSFFISKNFDSLEQGMYVNHMLTFFSVFANGMLGAWLYRSMPEDKMRTKAETALFTLVAGVCLWGFYMACRCRSMAENEQQWQVDYRYLLSLLFLVFVLSTIYAERWFQVIWDNRVMRFLSGISFNFYICHQYIAVKLKEWRIPFYSGQTAPNQLGDKVWQWKYLILCIGVSFVAAVVMTYAVEKPCSRWIRRSIEKNYGKE